MRVDLYLEQGWKHVFSPAPGNHQPRSQSDRRPAGGSGCVRHQLTVRLLRCRQLSVPEQIGDACGGWIGGSAFRFEDLKFIVIA